MRESDLALVQERLAFVLSGVDAAIDRAMPGDAFRGLEEARHHASHLAEAARHAKFNGSFGTGLLLGGLTGGVGYLFTPLVASGINRLRGYAVANEAEELVERIEYHSLLCLADAERLLARPEAERIVLRRLIQFLAEEDPRLPDPASACKWIGTRILAIHNVFAEFTEVLAHFAEVFGWRSWRAALAACGYHLSSENSRSHDARARSGRDSAAAEQALSILGLRLGATTEDIRRAFRTEMVKYHPDRHVQASPELQGLAAERVRQLTSARELLLAAT